LYNITHEKACTRSIENDLSAPSAENHSEIGFPCGFPYGFPRADAESHQQRMTRDPQFAREPVVSRFSARFSRRFSIPPGRKSPTHKPDAGRKHPKTGRGQVRQKGGSDPPFWAALRPRPSGLRASLPPSAYCETQYARVARVHRNQPKPSREDSTHRANLLFFGGL